MDTEQNVPRTRQSIRNGQRMSLEKRTKGESILKNAFVKNKELLLKAYIRLSLLLFSKLYVIFSQ